MTFEELLNQAIAQNNSLVCVGLDTDVEKIPAHLKSESDPIFSFNQQIIDTTAGLVCSFKTNLAFYAASGPKGMEALKKTIDYIHSNSSVPVILDAKMADIGNTSEQYAKEVFDFLGADAVTVNPYQGKDSLEPFLKRSDKGIIILCRTSNPGSSDFQDLLVDSEPLYVHVAKRISEWNEEYKNCLLVVGATTPNEMRKIREIVPDLFFLVPGIGPQGGNLEKTLQYGLTKEKSGLIIHSARAIIYASAGDDFADVARKETEKMRDILNKFRQL